MKYVRKKIEVKHVKLGLIQNGRKMNKFLNSISQLVGGFFTQ